MAVLAVLAVLAVPVAPALQAPKSIIIQIYYNLPVQCFVSLKLKLNYVKAFITLRMYVR